MKCALWMFTNKLLHYNGHNLMNITFIRTLWTKSSHFRATSIAVKHLLNTGASKPSPIWTPSPSFWISPIHTKVTKYSKMTTLEKLNFDNLVLRELPVEQEKNRTSRQVPGVCFSRIDPIPVENPSVVALAQDALGLIDLNEKECLRPEFAQYFGGCKILPGSETAAHCYCGHQFGHFSGQLGDGAAMYLGEIVNKKGERWEIQLKGAGRTPYSRTADGRKVLRSTIREFLCSEAMHHLGIPTTRAGVCITSDSYVIRDIFYTGDNIKERCSVVLRIAPSFIRFGSFEIFKDTDETTGRKGPSVGRTDILTSLLDYVVKTFYTEIWQANQADKPAAYLAFFREIVRRTACMVADWQSVGWCHGVLNTDNMSIVGVTIDYGPYGFIDTFDPDFICNASDDGGRYTYRKQAEMCKWNCMKLAESLSPIVPMEGMTQILDEYDAMFEQKYLQNMSGKFGLVKTARETDKQLFSSFFDALEKTGGDFTNCFRALSAVPAADSENVEAEMSSSVRYFVSQSCTLEEQKKAAAPRMDPRQLNMFMMLMQMNPDLLAQIGGGQVAIQKEMERIEISKKLKDKTQEQKSSEDEQIWSGWLKMYAQRVKQEIQEQGKEAAKQRRTDMDLTNPRFILRNYIAQEVIDKAEKGDYSGVNDVLRLLQNPYSDDIVTPSEEQKQASASGAACTASTSFVEKYADKPPAWASELRVT